MLVKSLVLRNIRSYNDDTEVRLDLPEGVVLFEGDIGSGKSTLLYALEFGLFGLSDMKGPHLLSEGMRAGGVSVTFEAGDAEYTVDRHLKMKGEDVVQDECYITSGGERTRLSPTDLKERVVALLGFNEPTHPKAESLVYRYAVFTPQEQMKEILVQNPEHRLQVIRRVLGAQSYQNAADNSELVEKRIKLVAYGLKKASEDLDEKEAQLSEVSDEAARLSSEIPRLSDLEASSARIMRGLEKELKETQGEREGLKKVEGRLPLLRQEALDLASDISEADVRLRELESALSTEIDPAITRFESRRKPRSTIEALHDRLSQSREELASLRESRRVLESGLERDRDLMAKGVCPVCGQRITGDLSARASHSERELTELAGRTAAAEALVAAVTEELEEARALEEDSKDHQRAVKEKARIEKEIRALRKKTQETNSKLSLRKKEIAEATAQAQEMQEVTKRTLALESKLDEARAQERQADLDLKEARTKLADVQNALDGLKLEVTRKKAEVERARHLNNYHDWMTSFFRPTVQLIEKQTLTQAAIRFNGHFQRFFTSLVDDPDMVVRVKEDFSPLFERQGFEQDFDALSGGERTSMALAYRFALNAVVKETASSRPELVILDEPTDGFSKEQVYKMRGLLEELDSKQVILVSHEKELESMADHVFRIEKVNGTSVVSVVPA